MPRHRKGSAVPAPGGESFGMEELGEPVYKVRLLPGGGVAKLESGEKVEVQDLGEPKYPNPQPPVVPIQPQHENR